MKEYQSNAFFKVKIDLLLRKMEDEAESHTASYGTRNSENEKPV